MKTFGVVTNTELFVCLFMLFIPVEKPHCDLFALFHFIYINIYLFLFVMFHVFCLFL